MSDSATSSISPSGEDLSTFQYKTRSTLQSDCGGCFGLCCVALAYAASSDFPVSKGAGSPCSNLQADFRCGIHTSLREQGYKGCTVYDCFGSGQRVSQWTYKGEDWRRKPESADEMYRVFPVMRLLHELLWYLADGMLQKEAASLHGRLDALAAETEALTHLAPTELLTLDGEAHRQKVNALLLEVSAMVRRPVRVQRSKGLERKLAGGRGADLFAARLQGADLRGACLRGACLIAADLRGADLRKADVIGADFRDTNVAGADLSECLFLTQTQVNAATGDSATRLPAVLIRPAHWS